MKPKPPKRHSASVKPMQALLPSIKNFPSPPPTDLERYVGRVTDIMQDGGGIYVLTLWRVRAESWDIKDPARELFFNLNKDTPGLTVVRKLHVGDAVFLWGWSEIRAGKQGSRIHVKRAA